MALPRPFRTETDLMARLVKAQNHPANVHQDITTWAGFCDTRTELEAHVVRNEEAAASYVAPSRKRSA